MNSPGDRNTVSHYIVNFFPSDDGEDENEFVIEEYEDEKYSENSTEHTSEEFVQEKLPERNDLPEKCALCGNVGKLFKITEAVGLASRINKYLPFINLQLNASICYKCLSTVNVWNAFYLNCSSVNSKLKCKSQTEKAFSKEANISAESLNNIIESYNQSNSNPSNENVLNSMEVLTDGLKSLIHKLRESSNRPTSPSINDSIHHVKSVSINEENGTFVEDPGVIEITVNTSNFDEEMKTNESEVDTFKPYRYASNWEDDFHEADINDPDRDGKEVVKRIQELKTLRNGTWFCDDDGYCFRVNKKHSGRMYVRCIEMSCRARGCISKNLFKYNRQKHSHPPTHGKNLRSAENHAPMDTKKLFGSRVEVKRGIPR